MKTKYNFSWYSFTKNILLIFTDGLSYLLSLYFAVLIRSFLPMIFTFFEFPIFFPAGHFSIHLIGFFCVIFIVFVWNRLYQTRYTFWEELLLIWKSLLVSGMITYIFLFNFDESLSFVSRVVILLLFGILMFLIPLLRMILKMFLYKICFWRTPMIVACHKDDFERAQHIANVFSKDFYLGFVPVGFFIDGEEQLTHDLPIYNKKEDIPYSALCVVDNPMHNNLLPYFYSNYRNIYMIPNNSTLGFKGLGGQYLFTERLFILKVENRLNSWVAQFVKNTMDRILCVLIILLLCPVFFIIAFLIKIKSPGPVLYRQTRVGKDGKEFKIWKFRTMYQDADKKLEELLKSDAELKKEWDMFFKLKNDPRITPIGSFLRKYSLDEFPQLLNVLMGEMSLIGPRPFVRGEIEEINPLLLPLFAQVKPGLTGLWQVSGRNQIDRLERINIDIWYIHHWSLSLDLLILLNTPVAVFSAKGAS